MKILLVSSYLPYPLLDGGRIRLYNLLKNLSDKHEITLICEKRPSQTQNDIDEVAKVCHKVIVIDRPKAWSLANVSRSLLSLSPLLITSHTNKQMKEKIREELLSGKYDLIHVETFYVMQNLPAGKAGLPIPIVLVEHNIEYMVYEKYMKKAPFLIRPSLYFDILKLKRKEKEAWKKADKLIAVSPKEQKIMGEGAELIPNGVDLEKFAFRKKSERKDPSAGHSTLRDKPSGSDSKSSGQRKKVLFIGNFKWVQNRDSAAFIIKNIWPRVVAKNPKLKLWIVGKNVPDNLMKLQNETIFFDENASDQTELIFQEADLLLSPIRVGGGTNFKILEAMASGTPVLTTSIGNEGINAKNGEEIIICEKPDEFVNKILLILSDDYLYEKLSRKGRIFVEKNFDWRIIANKLDEVYKNQLK